MGTIVDAHTVDAAEQIDRIASRPRAKVNERLVVDINMFSHE
jgi:hypothetical protein